LAFSTCLSIGEAFERAKVAVGKFDARREQDDALANDAAPQERVGEGSFIFINSRAQKSPIAFRLYGKGAAIAKAPDSVDPNLQLIQLEYEEVKNSDDLPSLKAFVDTYKGNRTARPSSD
jgi:hypothetical protein